MIKPGVIVALVLGLSGTAALARAPDTSLRPVARPGAVTVAVAEVAPPATATYTTAVIVSLRPKAAPRNVQPVQPEARRMVQTARVSGQQHHEATASVAQPQRVRSDERRVGLFQSLRPLLRSRKVETQAVARRQQLARGAVCGDPAIQGTMVGRVSGRVSGCGIEDAVRVRAINGIPLSREATIDCTTARTFKSWVQSGLAPTVGNMGGGVARIEVIGGYSCRTRNSQRGAKISEHGKGRALDIAGFTLRDGTDISVLDDWGRGKKGQVLKNLHRTACGPFGTVLGPNSDHFHNDHLHFDTARHRNGSYCR